MSMFAVASRISVAAVEYVRGDLDIEVDKVNIYSSDADKNVQKRRVQADAVLHIIREPARATRAHQLPSFLSSWRARRACAVVVSHPHAANRVGVGRWPPPANLSPPADEGVHLREGLHQSGHNAINFPGRTRIIIYGQ